jgi:RNA polymerase sigma-70 factor (ECF subfamily)
MPDAPDVAAELRAAGTRRQERFAQLFELHRARLLRMVELRMNPRLRQRIGASDVLQDAFLESSKRLPDWLEDPSMPFHLWLRFLTAQNLARLWRFHAEAKKRDVRRQVASAHPRLPSASSVVLVDRLVASGISPTQAVVKEEMRGELLQAFEAMKPQDREVLVLRHFEELSNAECAQELGIQEDAASKRYLRALERLRKVLEQQERQGGEVRE